MRACTFSGAFGIATIVLLLSSAGYCTRRECEPTDISCNTVAYFLYSGRCPATNPNPEPLLFGGFVVTVAGSAGSAGATDGIGTAARFDGPNGLTADFQNVYLVEGANNKVRAFNRATGVVTTLAGTGAAGTVDGTLAAAQFTGPTDIGTDCQNLYVSEGGNSVIRKIDVWNNQVTTIAGLAGVTALTDGIGSAARFSNPRGNVVVGNFLYIADFNNHAIRRLNLQTHEVLTVAGNGTPGTLDGIGTAATLNQPAGIEYLHGFLYVGELGSAVIRRIDPVTTEVLTVAGMVGSPGFADGPGTAAQFNQPALLARDFNSLYVTDISNRVVRRISVPDYTVSTIAGMTGVSGDADGPALGGATFTQGVGITSDGTDLFIGDFSRNTLRKLD